MFVAIRFRHGAMPVVRADTAENAVRSLLIAACLICMALGGYASTCSAQSVPTPSGVSICDDPKARGTAAYNKNCGACYPQCGNAGNGNKGNAAAAAAQAAAAAAAAAQRQRDAELEQQRIEADNKRRMEELANQAKFIDDRDAAAGTLRGSTGVAASGGVGASGLRGSSATPELRGSTPIATSNPGDTSVVDLSDTNLADANRALMRHQWAMSIDQRYKADPQVQQYIRDLWDSASKNNSEALGRIRSILADQLKVSGLTDQQVHDFFATFDTFTTGQGSIPKAWDKASAFAHEIDSTATKGKPQRPYYEELVSTLGKTESIKTHIFYMGTGPQTTDDCVLHAISNGAQVPFAQVKAVLEPTLRNLAIARIEVRKTPELAVTSQKNGGTGGLNPFEEILIAKQVGSVIGVPDKNFAKAIESTGRPVITSVVIDAYNSNHDLVAVGNHEVAVTGVYRTVDGEVYYSVMDSNLKTHPNYTAYVEKNDFENHLVFSGGYVVVQNEKH
jgi:hypothetical protein